MTSIDITVPEGWQDVKLKTFQEFVSTEMTNDLKGHVKRISILCDVDSEVVANLPIVEFKKLNADLTWSNTHPKSSYDSVFELDGQKYEMMDLSNVSVGEYTDLEFNVGEGLIANLHKILAILYRPIENDKYDSQSVNERSEKFRERLNIAGVYGAALFFYRIVRPSSKNLRHCLRAESRRQKTKLEGRLQEKESVG